MSAAAPGLREAFEADRGYLWSLSYRLTGSAADADDVVQETFVRALERPPARTDAPWRPWLVRVALNLGRDLLRRRRRRGYIGPWLPAPVETGEGEPPAFDPPDLAGLPSARYDLLESVSTAFLLALETLTPGQRAVLLLRDVFDYSVREAAEALAMTEANVKTSHLRARRAMAAYDGARRPATPAAHAQAREALLRFLDALARADLPALEAMLADEVRFRSDSGGEFAAARVPVLGRHRVGRLLLGLGGKLDGRPPRVELRTLNGLPGAVFELQGAPAGWAPRAALQLQLDAAGRVVEVLTVVASRKLAALR